MALSPVEGVWTDHQFGSDNRKSWNYRSGDWKVEFGVKKKASAILFG